MSDSLLKALKIFVVVGAVVIVGGTATLIWLLVKRGTSMAVATAPAAAPQEPGTIALPPGAEVSQIAAAGPELLLLGRTPGEGQFLLVVDAKSGATRRLLRLVPAPP
jgi:hypothetical protein